NGLAGVWMRVGHFAGGIDGEVSVDTGSAAVFGHFTGSAAGLDLPIRSLHAHVPRARQRVVVSGSLRAPPCVVHGPQWSNFGGPRWCGIGYRTTASDQGR